jgi:hypothetical protein
VLTWAPSLLRPNTVQYMWAAMDEKPMPKLLSAIPFTPVPGPRLLARDPAARTALLNEALTGNLSDEQRALLSAEALLADAQATVLLHLSQAGNPMAPNRLPNNAGQGFLPVSQADFTEFSGALEGAGGLNTPCSGGYCAFSPTPGAALGDWWTTPATVDAMWPLGAAFGSYTGAVPAAGTGRG